MLQNYYLTFGWGQKDKAGQPSKNIILTVKAYHMDAAMNIIKKLFGFKWAEIYQCHVDDIAKHYPAGTKPLAAIYDAAAIGGAEYKKHRAGYGSALDMGLPAFAYCEFQLGRSTEVHNYLLELNVTHWGQREQDILKGMVGDCRVYTKAQKQDMGAALFGDLKPGFAITINPAGDE